MTRRELATLAERLRGAFRPWTRTPTWAAREALRRFARGESYHAIAPMIGVTHGTVRYYILSWLSGGFVEPGHGADIRRSRARLLARHARSIRTQSYWAAPRRYTPERWEQELRRVANNRQTFVETAQKLRVTPHAVYQQARREIAGLGVSAALPPLA